MNHTRLFVVVLCIGLWISFLIDEKPSQDSHHQTSTSVRYSTPPRTTSTSSSSNHRSSSSASPSSSPNRHRTNGSQAPRGATMPDCDDYEDYDEFMDDWDGAMPDGSDAEDYWENW